MFEDDNRTSRRGITIIQRYNKTIVARCDWGPWVLYTLEGKWHPWLRLGCHFPSRVYKTPWTPSQRATIINDCIMLQEYLPFHHTHILHAPCSLYTVQLYVLDQCSEQPGQNTYIKGSKVIPVPYSWLTIAIPLYMESVDCGTGSEHLRLTLY